MNVKELLIYANFLLIFLSCNSDKPKNNTVLEGYVFGTTYKIIHQNDGGNYQTSIDSVFHLINKSLSTYIPTSDISKINKGDTTVVVDSFFIEVFKKSKRIFTETNGYFDPTVGNLVNAWGFGPKKMKKDLSLEEVAEEMKFVGFDKVLLLDGKVVTSTPKIYLDFNSIAKGYGIDVVARFFDSKNIDNYLIEIGGEIRAKGFKKDSDPWKIGFDNPNTDGTRSVSKFVNLSNKSMATSGNYRKFRLSESGKKFVHTINPKTGYATESNLLSASVIADLDCADVDAYATAFMAMGFEQTLKFLKAHPRLKVVLIYSDAKGDIKEYQTLQ